ncbi:MAG TPA: hypothetical protein DEP69_07425, partial [Acidimicrobiaceae bacterium]|nr:hypothetical protein [Acidimicrobiaceae bacterium]
AKNDAAEAAKTGPVSGGSVSGGSVVASAVAAVESAVDLVSRAARELRSGEPPAASDAAGLRRVVERGASLRSSADALLAVAASRLETLARGAARQALIGGARLSKRETNKIAGVAKKVDAMPRTLDAMANGEMNLDQAGILVAAADEHGAEAVDNSQELRDLAAHLSADRFAVETRETLRRRDDVGGEERLARQRARRNGRIFDGDGGMKVLQVEFDPVAGYRVQRAIARRVEEMFRADGGGDGTERQVRTNAQRFADAAFEKLTGLDPATHEPAGGDGGAGGADGTDGKAGGTDGKTSGADGKTGKTGRTGRGRTPALRRPGLGRPDHLVVVAELGLIDGTRPNGRCDILGHGPVTPAVLRNLGPDTKLTAAIFSANGQPLWLGRTQRIPSTAQELAAKLRDRGCVKCGATTDQVDIHHVAEYHADHGPTDIDNLACLCRRCHQDLHKTRHRLALRPDGTWATQPRCDDSDRAPP